MFIRIEIFFHFKMKLIHVDVVESRMDDVLCFLHLIKPVIQLEKQFLILLLIYLGISVITMGLQIVCF